MLFMGIRRHEMTNNITGRHETLHSGLVKQHHMCEQLSNFVFICIIDYHTVISRDYQMKESLHCFPPKNGNSLYSYQILLFLIVKFCSSAKSIVVSDVFKKNKEPVTKHYHNLQITYYHRIKYLSILYFL